MVEIECLARGKTIKMPDFIDTERYDDSQNSSKDVRK